MAVTLANVRAGMQDALSAQVIDEFCKSSYLLDNMVFDDAVTPMGGGASMTYAYTRVTTWPTAGTRAVNTEYTAHEAEKKRYIVDLKVMGGSFEIDRVLAGMGGVIDEVQFQIGQKVKATQACFSDLVINGDSSVDANGFDGLSKALTGSATEFAGNIDLSSSANVTGNYLAFLDLLDEMIGEMDGAPTCLMGNTRMMAKIRACARRATMYQTGLDGWGRQIEYYGAVPLIDLGTKAGTNSPIVATSEAGETSLYAVRMGLDGFHGVSVSGQSPIRTWLPDFSTAGAVKKGEVEMVAAVALKSSKAAAVMRGLKVM